MVYVQGKARIRHIGTGEVYEINGDMIDFELVGAEERGMGPEKIYSAVIHHPQLGQLLWSLTEYPTGAENNREMDIGPHILLENIEFNIENELPDNYEGEDRDDENRQARVAALVEWFLGRYEDPVHRLPYVSAEGGYQWIYGGPFDAREELEGNFPDEAEDIIQSAVDEIESDGLFEWAPVASPDDYDDQYDDKNLSDLALELKTIAADLPEPASDPVFRFGDDGLLHLATPPDVAARAESNTLLIELRAATGDLLDALAGTNAHTHLLRSIEKYSEAISGEAISISQIYARGVRLANAADAAQRTIAKEELSPLPEDAGTHLSSVLDLNGAYIMAHPEGRKLAEGANAYRQALEDVDAIRDPARRLADAIEATPKLFGEDVRTHVSKTVADVGRGPRPERSNQVAASTFDHLFKTLLKSASVVGATIVGEAIAGSNPGHLVSAGGSETINLLWTFLTTHASTLHAVAGVFAADLTWMTPVSDLLQRLKRLLDRS